jgi:hypothetical protein
MRKPNRRKSFRAASLCALLLAPAGLVSVQACTDLDESPPSAITPESFFKNSDEVIGGLASVYANLRNTLEQYYNLSQVGADEHIVPTRGTDWFDGGRWLEMDRQAWTPISPSGIDDVNAAWNNMFAGVARANVLLAALETVEVPDKEVVVAEARTLRAYYYYCLLDLFGGVPVVTTTEVAARPRDTADSVFRFIESELLAAREALPATRPAAEYGRVTKGAADAILASLYLNAQVFTGELSATGLTPGAPRWDDAIAAADRVINSGLYTLAADWKSNFTPTNESSPENIFTIRMVPQDGLGLNFAYRHSHYNQISPQPWNGFATIADVYNQFDAADLRREIFLVGPQRHLLTGEPVTDRQGNPLVFTVEIQDPTQASEGEGARIYKFPVDPAVDNGSSGNDYPWFRLAEMYLIKAEALNELGDTPGAVDLVNLVRARVFEPDKPVTAADQATFRNVILQERLFEFTGEGKRRQDLIRHGKWTDAWLFKEAREPYRVRMPIPQTQINSNPMLTQNAGY